MFPRICIDNLGAREMLMPREIDADVNAGYSLVECLREMEERRAKIGE